MQIKEWQEAKIIAVMCAFENSKTSIDYDAVFVYPDGLNDRRQVTLSIGFTEDGGNLNKLLQMYCFMNGKYKKELVAYLPKIGTGVLHASLSFKALLKEMAQNDPLFPKCQEFAYRALYVNPAYAKCDAYGIKTALGALIFQDSYLHGSLDDVAKMFAYPRPARGGDEKEFLTQYCTTRRRWWLNNDNNPQKGIEGKGTYRMDCMLDCIKRGNWDLSLSINANGVRV